MVYKHVRTNPELNSLHSPHRPTGRLPLDSLKPTLLNRCCRDCTELDLRGIALSPQQLAIIAEGKALTRLAISECPSVDNLSVTALLMYAAQPTTQLGFYIHTYMRALTYLTASSSLAQLFGQSGQISEAFHHSL